MVQLMSSMSLTNVTLSYTHPGQNENIQVMVFLPENSWNGRMQHIGGAGYQAGLHAAGINGMLAAIGEGYVSLGTNAGLGSDVLPDDWALLSPGNVNMYLLDNLMSVSLNDAAVLGKSIINSYYGQPPVYSYFSSCSQGGRQGLRLAQQYPDAYDGIAASAPAINWNELFVGDYYGIMLMNMLQEYPAPCEFNAITDAILLACDPIDGLVDSVITDPSLCNFNISSVVGQSVNCTDTGTFVNVSSTAAFIAQSIFGGARKTDGSFISFGIEKGALLTTTASTDAIASVSLAPTTCTNGTCYLLSDAFLADWTTYFVLRNATADIGNMTHEDFDTIFHSSVQQYSNTESNDPDLSAFRARGGKLISYHGLADLIIPTNSTTSYYDAVTALDANVHDFYRLFLAPGLSHCFGGNGAYPDGTFDAMRKWVEQGIAPDTLNATTVSAPIVSRILCPYPQKQYYNGNNTASATGRFYCK